MKDTTQATILTPKEATDYKTTAPPSWKKAAGLLRERKKDLKHHLRTVRNEWDRICLL